MVITRQKTIDSLIKYLEWWREYATEPTPNKCPQCDCVTYLRQHQGDWICDACIAVNNVKEYTI